MVALYDGSDALAPQEVITGKGVIDTIQDDGDTACAGGREYVVLKFWLGIKGDESVCSLPSKKRNNCY